jgi:voltage-gated potassium channel
MNVRRRLALSVSLLCLLVLLGTAGYMAIEGWSLLDALYQTVTTLSTVGFREVHPLSTAGQIFTIILIIGGVGGVLYTLTAVVTVAVEGELLDYFGRRRMEARIQALRGHAIICGFGRVGREIAAEFKRRDVPFVVVDHNPHVHPLLRALGYAYIDGNATSDEVLLRAGVERAACLLAAADSDTDNTFIVLSARALKPDIFIVARAGQPEAERKLRRAGADRVISPYSIAGLHMAIAALQPAIVDFMTTTFRSREGDLILAEITVTAESELAGRTIHQLFGGRPDTIALALRREGGELRAAPPPQEVLRLHDRLIVLGPPRELEFFATRTGAKVPVPDQAPAVE